MNNSKLHIEQFVDVLKDNGGSVKVIKLPSFVHRIKTIALLITNPVLVFDDNPFYIENRILNVNKSIIPAISTTIELFSQNNSIIDYILMNNEFKTLVVHKKEHNFYEIQYHFDITKISLPINTENVLNTDTRIIFKQTDTLENLLKTEIEYANWKPNVDLYINYD